MSLFKAVAITLALVMLFCYGWSLKAPLTAETVYRYNAYTEVEQERGTWAELRSRQFGLGGLPRLVEPWFQAPILEDLITDTSKLQLEDSLAVHVYLNNRTFVQKARSGFFTWGSSEANYVFLDVRILDTESKLLGMGTARVYQTPLLESDIRWQEQAETQRNTLIPTGFHPSILWVLLVYLGLLGIYIVYVWCSQPWTVTETSRKRILEGAVFTGDWEKVKEKTVKLPKYKYTSPRLAEFLPGEDQQQVKITSYTVVSSQFQEARTGPLVWARAKDTHIDLMLVVESGNQRFSPQIMPEVYRHQDRDFGDLTALANRGTKRRRWLFSVGLRW